MFNILITKNNFSITRTSCAKLMRNERKFWKIQKKKQQIKVIEIIMNWTGLRETSKNLQSQVTNSTKASTEAQRHARSPINRMHETDRQSSRRGMLDFNTPWLFFFPEFSNFFFLLPWVKHSSCQLLTRMASSHLPTAGKLVSGQVCIIFLHYLDHDQS